MKKKALSLLLALCMLLSLLPTTAFAANPALSSDSSEPVEKVYKYTPTKDYSQGTSDYWWTDTDLIYLNGGYSVQQLETKQLTFDSDTSMSNAYGQVGGHDGFYYKTQTELSLASISASLMPGATDYTSASSYTVTAVYSSGSDSVSMAVNNPAAFTLGTSNMTMDSTDATKMLVTVEYGNKTCTVKVPAPLVGIKAACKAEYAVGATLNKSDFTVKAYYTCTDATEIPSQISDTNKWSIKTLNANDFTLSTGTMPEDGKVTVTYGEKTDELTLTVAEAQPAAINTVTPSVTAPVAGSTPATFTAPDNTSVVSGTEKWTRSGSAFETFAAGYTYQYEVVLEANSTSTPGYVFGDDVSVSVTGADEVDYTLGGTCTSGVVSGEGNKYLKITAQFTLEGSNESATPVASTKPFTSNVNTDAKDLNTYASAHNRVLESGVYYLSGNYTFNGNSTYTYGLKIADNATVYIYLNGYTLTANGKNAYTASSNGYAGGAGIDLPSSANLYFVGEGTVNANGGKGGKGFSGSKGGGSTADVIDNWPSTDWDYDFTYGTGGAGGAGGFGAGAGIGTAGSKDGTAPASSIGTVTLVQDYANAITLNAKGGATGARGANGAGGSSGSDWEIGWFSNGYASVEGAGGGGGGAGGSAGADIGIGGIQGVSGDKGNDASQTAHDYTCCYTHADTGTNGADNTPQSAQGADKSSSAKVVYTLQGITTESKFNALYDDAENGEAIKAALTDPANLNVYAYFYKDNAQNHFSEDARNAALNGTYVDDGRYLPTSGENDKWIVWQLDENRYDASATIDTSASDHKAVLTVAYAPISASVKSSDRASWILKVAHSGAENAEAPTNVNQTINIPLLSNQAKDDNGSGNVVGGGDAIKFNDTSKFAEAATNVYFAASERQVYGNKDYNLKDASGEALNGEKTNVFSFIKNSGNKYYTVNYKPYNAYIGAMADGNWVLGSSATNFTNAYTAMDDVAFRNAGLYCVTERVTRKANWGVNGTIVTGDTMSKTFDDIRYYVIEQADLKISNAIDTVTCNTTVQDHTFDREVIGQNGEKVQGQYTFASNTAISTQNTYCYGESWADANAQNQSANASTPKITGIVWEFNVKHTYNTTDISNTAQNGPGDRNMNNYLDQNDGTQLSKYKGTEFTIGGTSITGTLSADRNTFYSGTNGELRYAETGVAVLEDNDHLTVQAKYEADQKITANGAGSDNYKTDWESLDSSDNVTGSITSVFAEDVAFGAKFSNPNYGFRVNYLDAVSGDTFGGTPVTAENFPSSSITFTSGASVQFSNLVDESKQYKGDYYVVTVKDGSGNVVKSWDYNDTDNDTPITANVPVGSEYELSASNDWDAFEAGTYTVYVDYVGLYYQNTTGAEGRESGWNGTEAFNWVTATKNFTLTIEPRNIAYKPMNDLYKVYDGTDLLVKDTLSNGDVTSASAYIIKLTEGKTTGIDQFNKGLSNDVATNFTAGSNESNLMYNFLQPTNTSTKYTSDYHTYLELELAGTYAESGKAAGSQTVTVSASRLLDTADDQNYNLISVNNQALSGEVFVAQMYVEHNMTAAVKVHDTTPMRDVLNLHAKAYMPSGRSMSYGTDGYLASTGVFFDKQELIDKDDVTNKSVYPTSSDSFYDYDAQYALVLDTNSAAYIAHDAGNGYVGNTDGFQINGGTGAVEKVAKLTSNNTNPANFLKVTMTLQSFGNYVLIVDQDEDTSKYPSGTFGKCTESTAKNGNRDTTVYSSYYDVKDGNVHYATTGAPNDETLSHTILYYMAGNGDTFNLYLPINQLNKRPVASVFANAVGSAHDVTVGSEKYQYVTVYENGDSAEFSFTAPQNSYLKDVKIVALGTNDSVPFASIDTTKLVGKFFSIDNTNGKISENYDSKKCELYLELVGVNGVSNLATTSLYFNNDVAENAGYSAYKLAAPNEQIGGSTYTFRFTTGESEMGTECKLVIVPEFEDFETILEKTSYTTNLSVEQKVTGTSDETLTYTGASDDYVYVNYKTLWDTTAGVSSQYGTVNMSYTDNGSTVSLTEQILGANFKDQYNSFGIYTEGDNAAFFDPAKLLPGTEVSVTLKVWRNGVVADLQSSTDADAMDEVTFTWTVSQEDYYRLFKDDVVVFRSSNEMEADTAIATAQKIDNIYGYGITSAPASMDFTAVTFVSNAVSATKETKNILTTYADTWYKVDNSTGTRMTINASNKTMSGLALGDNLYPTYEYAKLQRVTTTNNVAAAAIDLGYARVIFGQITLNNAFVYTNSASIGVAPYSTTSYTGATKTAYTDTADLYWFDGWYKNSDVVSATVNGTITDDGSTPTYTIKEHVNYVTFKDGATTIGYGILDTSKDTKVTTLNFAAVPFTVTQPTIGTANSTTSKNMTFEGTNHYTKTNYTLNGWYTDSAKTEANKVADVTSVAVSPADTFYLKSTYNGGGGSIGGGGAPAPTKFTVPVTGDKDTVAVEATINGKDATIDNVTDKEIETVGTGANVIVDLSGVNKTITSVTIPKTTFENIADSDADGLEVDFPDGTVAAFNTTTVAAIASQATSANIQLVVEQRTNAEKTLTTAQKATVKELQNALVIDAYLVSNGKRISDFKGGEADLTVSYPTTKPVRVWYVAEDGSKTLVPSTFDGKCVTFVVKHFSHYVIEVLDDAQGGYANCPQDETCVYAKFTDADTEAWYHDGVHFCVENGYMQGVSTTAFDPSGTTSRAMIVTMLWRMEGEPVVNYAMSFKDVKGGQWYTEAIRWAQSTGVVEGYSAEKFGPNDPITREQMAAILYRYAKYHEIDVANTNTLAGFTDTDKVSAWALDAMKWANAIGLVQGRTTTTLVPEMNITRAEAATMVQRYCETFKK